MPGNVYLSNMEIRMILGHLEKSEVLYKKLNLVQEHKRLTAKLRKHLHRKRIY